MTTLHYQETVSTDLRKHTVMLDMQVLFAFLLGMAESRVVARNSDHIRLSALNAYTGTIDSLTTVDSGTSLWLSGPGTHNFFGNLDNSGAIVVSQTDNTLRAHIGQYSHWAGISNSNGNLINRAGASILLNDVNAITGTDYEWYLNSMENDGILQWCSRGDILGSVYQLWSKDTSVNNGLIVFEQLNGNKGVAAVWRNNLLDTTGSALVNNGGFLMRSMRVDFVHNLKGTGCLMIGNSAIMYMQDGTGLFQNPTAAPTFAGQSISFLDKTGILHMAPQVYHRNSNFGATIYNFGAGNAIEFFDVIKTFSYYESVLSVTMWSGDSVRLSVGTGYNARGFYTGYSTTFYGRFNAIYYSDAAPSSSPPATCSWSTDRCADISSSVVPGPESLLSSAQPSTSVSLQSAANTAGSTAFVTAPTTKLSFSTAAPTTIVTGGISVVTGSSATLSDTISIPTTIPTVSLTAIPTATNAVTFLASSLSGLISPVASSTASTSATTAPSVVHSSLTTLLASTTTSALTISSASLSTSASASTTSSAPITSSTSAATTSTLNFSSALITSSVSSISSVVKIPDVATSLMSSTSLSLPSAVTFLASSLSGLISSGASSTASTSATTAPSVVHSSSSTLLASMTTSALTISSASLSTSESAPTTSSASITSSTSAATTSTRNLSSALITSSVSSISSVVKIPDVATSSMSSTSLSLPVSTASSSSAALLASSTELLSLQSTSTGSSLTEKSSAYASSIKLSSSVSLSSTAMSSSEAILSSTLGPATFLVSASSSIDYASAPTVSSLFAVSTSSLSSALSSSIASSTIAVISISGSASGADSVTTQLPSSTSLVTTGSGSLPPYGNTSASSTASGPVASSSSTSSANLFYLRSTCDNSCVATFSTSNQIYSNMYNTDNSTYTPFYLSGSDLYDAAASTLCVASESGGSANAFKCSGDLDYINGTPVSGGWAATASGLAYNNATTFYGCGVFDLANSYEPTGLSYTMTNGDTTNCRQCQLIAVRDIAQCNTDTTTHCSSY